LPNKFLKQSGKVPPNQRLIELEIAGDLGISRTTVREAFKRLEVTGYVTTLPTGALKSYNMVKYWKHCVNDAHVVPKGL